ncbi:dienelactone hydrolase family protein, partial [Pseudomonas aeruginosa]
VGVQVGLVVPHGLLVAGVDSAGKGLEEGLPSDRLMARWAASEGLGL